MHRTIIPILILHALPLFPARADVTIGNQFFVGAHPEAVSVDAAVPRSARFTAPEDVSITAVQVKLKEASAESITLSLQPDDGSGKPSGKPLAFAEIAPPAAGWNRAALSKTELRRGKVYHLVAEVKGGSADWLRINSVNRGTQPSGAPDAEWSAGSDVADARASWVFILETGTPQNLGQPYVTRINTQTVTKSNIPAQRFVFAKPATGESKLSSVALYLSAGDEAPSGEYTLALLDAENHVITSVKIPPAEITNGTTQFYSFALPEKPKLIPGAAYAVAFFNDSETGRLMWVSEASDADDAAEKATWQGQAGHAVFYEDPGLQTRKDADPKRDFIFTLTLE